MELVDGAEATPTDVTVNSEEKTDQEVLVEILPAVTSGGGSSKWPHEVGYCCISDIRKETAKMSISDHYCDASVRFSSILPRLRRSLSSSICLSLSVSLSFYQSIYLSISVSLSFNLSIYLFTSPLGT